MSNLHNYHEAVKTILFEKIALMNLVFRQKWMRYVTLAQIYG